MGLDIDLWVENSDEIFPPDYYDVYDRQHRLSRTFCNFMWRNALPTDNPELDQIGKITGVDISPLYEMNTYGSDEELSFFLEVAETEAEKAQLIARANEAKEKLRGNIDRVLHTIVQLIAKLETIENLPALLDDHGDNLLNNEEYFRDFNVNNEEGLSWDHFGIDLRNFRNFLEYAKSKGSKTVYFRYG